MSLLPVRYSNAYSSIEPCPAESTKRSRSGHFGSAASNFKNCVNSTVAISAAPLGRPGRPGFGLFHGIHGEAANRIGHTGVIDIRHGDIPREVGARERSAPGLDAIRPRN